MSKTPIISVIVPVYNVEPYLDRCVESLLAQSWPYLQILLINDGSRDGSGALCDGWAQKEPRIMAIHKENGGLSSARNEGLRYATGEYVMFIDSDDVIHPDMCKTLLYAVQENDAQMATCEPAHTFDNQQPPFTLVQDWKVMTREEAIRHMWYQTGFFPSACTKLYKTELFAATRFTVGLLFEDVDIMHKLLWQVERVVSTSSALYGYMHRGESITTQSFSVRALDILAIAEKLLAFAAENAPQLTGAARAYAVTAALRIELNAPNTEEFAEGRRKARKWIKEFGKQVLKDPAARRKNRYALCLYFLCRPLLRYVYKHINRWK